MQEKIEIPFSKTKVFFAIGGSILFVSIGIWLITLETEYQNYSMSLIDLTIIKGAGILAILFFGTTAIYSFRKLFDKKVGLIINSNGITDNSSESSFGLIQWSDISKIKIEKRLFAKLILIIVSNPEKYIRNARNKKSAKLMLSNLSIYGTPHLITSNNFKYDFRKLEELIQSEFKRNKCVTL